METIETGDFRFEVIDNWGVLPDGWSAGVVTGVVVDSQDRVYVCQQQRDPPVLVFDQEGRFLNSWGSSYVVEPHTMFMDRDDFIYLADRGDHVALKLSLDGQVLLELGNRGQPSDTGCFEDEGVVIRAAGPFNRPTRFSPAPSGDLYVSDGYRNSRVHRFANDGSLIDSWGQPGTGGPGEFFSPHSLWVDSDGLVYVCDRKNNRIQIFNAVGEFEGQWTNVQLPTDLHIGQNGLFYLAERESNEATENLLTIRDRNSNVLASWATPRSHQIWPDARGDIYLVSGAQTSSPGGVATKYISTR